jgi:1A family penicillin-binding protein
MKSQAAFIHRARIVFYAILGIVGIGVLAAVFFFFILLKELPRVPDPLSRIIDRPATEIYAATGERILVLGGREAVPLDRVSPFFLQAIVAIEDHRFWNHHGADKIRLAKALLEGIQPKHRIRATSTITQQLAKNLFFSIERSVKRKFLEALVAFQLESRYTKEDILQAYINQIAFGVNGFGIEQAARTFFDKPARDLTLAEASLLAGLPQSPSGYNPYYHLDRAKTRQQAVLRRMVAAGYIKQSQADEAAAAQLNFRPRKASTNNSNFLDVVIRKLEERYGPQIVYSGGLRVTTTLDMQLQQQAVEAIRKGMARMDEEMGLSPQPGDAYSEALPQAALIAIETNSGAVKAVIGGRDYQKSEYNRAIQNNRQPGSGFKPFTYFAAMDSLGINPATVMEDKKVSIPVKGAPDWTPSNFGREFIGKMILKSALMNSINSIAAQLVGEMGPEKVIETARKCGIASPLENVYSIALGTSGVSPLEMASAFGVFAAGGVRYEPFWIWRVEDVYGRALEEHIVNGQKILDPALVFQLVDMMKAVVDQGTAKVIRRMGFQLPAAGKTGTTNGYVDAWFTGFTPSLSVSIWTGYDNHSKGLRDKKGAGITGGRAAAPIWADFMIRATEGEPAREFAVPPGIHFENVDPITGYITAADSPHSIRVAMRASQHAPSPAATEPPIPVQRRELPSSEGSD